MPNPELSKKFEELQITFNERNVLCKQKELLDILKKGDTLVGLDKYKNIVLIGSFEKKEQNYIMIKPSLRFQNKEQKLLWWEGLTGTEDMEYTKVEKELFDIIKGDSNITKNHYSDLGGEVQLAENKIKFLENLVDYFNHDEKFILYQNKFDMMDQGLPPQLRMYQEEKPQSYIKILKKFERMLNKKIQEARIGNADDVFKIKKIIEYAEKCQVNTEEETIHLKKRIKKLEKELRKVREEL